MWVRAIFCLVCFLALGASARALDLSSQNFILRDPLSVIEGGSSTSTNFRFFSSTGQTVIGESTATTFLYRSGFLYFPIVTSPVLSATAGNGEVTLTWSAATAALGFTVTSYHVGQSTVSGGQYDYTNVGNVLTSVRTGLTNGTTYFFIIRVQDALGDVIATSTQVAAQPTNPGGGGLPPPPGVVPPPPVAVPPSAVQPTPALPVFATVLIIRGRAYPASSVIFLKDGERAASAEADSDGNFELRMTGLSPGSYLFAVYATDSTGRRSAPVTIFTTVEDEKTTVVDGIFIGPTIDADKREVALGEVILLFGETIPNADVTIFVTGEDRLILSVNADSIGHFAYRLQTGNLRLGEYLVKTEARRGDLVSALSKTTIFRVGTTTVFAPPFERCGVVADVNSDCRIDLIDFSVLLFWFNVSNPPVYIDFDGNGSVDLSDFSILIYYWTG